jgi:REP element-mobilizing transposase RayT
MIYNPEKHHRLSVRLKHYDYAQAGAYFVTMCSQNRECLFGNIINGEIKLNECGEIAETCLTGIPDHFNNVTLDEYIVMPNHIHVIFVMDDTNDSRHRRGLINQTPTNITWIFMKNLIVHWAK